MKYSQSFEQFWKLYPGRINTLGRIRKQDKLGAFKEWRKLNHTEKLLAMFSHPEQGTFTPDARKWLYHKRWEDEDLGRVMVEAAKTKLYPLKGRMCGIRDCLMPAVWRGSAGGYDYYRCGEHMPDKVKEKYVG